MIEEYEQKYNLLKSKEQALEKQNKNLENELDRLNSNSGHDVIQHMHKLETIEQANRILQEESENLRSHNERLETQNLKLDNELKRANEAIENLANNNNNNGSNKNFQTEEFERMHNHKLEAMQQANRILEDELTSLKEQQRQEKLKLKDKIDLLTSKHNERVKHLEELNRSLENEVHMLRQNISSSNQNNNSYNNDDDLNNLSSTLNLFRSQCDSLKKRIIELEMYENTYKNLEKEIDRLKIELKDKDHYYADEMKKIEQEKKSFNELNAGYTLLNETMLSMSRKYEQDLNNFDSKCKNLQNMLEKKDLELVEYKRLKEQELAGFIHKLSLSNEENMNLLNQVKNMSLNLGSKEEELSKLKKRFADLNSENEQNRTKIKSLDQVTQDLATSNAKLSNAQSRCVELESRLEDSMRKHNRELNDLKGQNNSHIDEINKLRQILKNEALRFEKLQSDYEQTRVEINKMELVRIKAEQYERELYEIKSSKLERLNELEFGHKKYSETLEKYENEIKLLNAQMINIVIRIQFFNPLFLFIDQASDHYSMVTLFL